MMKWVCAFVTLLISCIGFADTRAQQISNLQQYVLNQVQQPTDVSQKQSLAQIIAQGANNLRVAAVTQSESNEIAVGIILPQLMQDTMSPYMTQVMNRSGYDFSQLTNMVKIANGDDATMDSVLQAISRMSPENRRLFLLDETDYFNHVTDEKDKMAIANLALDNLKDPADLMSFCAQAAPTWPRNNVQILNRLLTAITKFDKNLSDDMTCNFLSSLDLYSLDEESTSALKSALAINPAATQKIVLMLAVAPSMRCASLHADALAEFNDLFRTITAGTVARSRAVIQEGNRCSYAEYIAKLPELLRPYVVNTMLSTSYTDSLGCSVNILITPMPRSRVSIRVDAMTSKTIVTKILPTVDSRSMMSVLQAFALQF